MRRSGNKVMSEKHTQLEILFISYKENRRLSNGYSDQPLPPIVILLGEQNPNKRSELCDLSV